MFNFMKIVMHSWIIIFMMINLKYIIDIYKNTTIKESKKMLFYCICAGIFLIFCNLYFIIFYIYEV